MGFKLLKLAVVSAILTQIRSQASPLLVPLPTPITSGFTQEDLDSLWRAVEEGSPVLKANITHVLEPIANFSVGPEPPRFRPEYLQDATKDLKLPKGFLYGVSTSAVQVEGAAKEGGRGPSNYDFGCHTIPSFCGGASSDITVNEYYQYKQDIQRVKAMGVNTHSFSISWARILPFGIKGSPVSEAGLQFYDDFIDELIKNDIEPIATLFHWDVPLNIISQYGGFLNDSIVEDFNNYASIVFQHYGNKIKTWFTFNEPHIFCGFHSGPPYTATYPPGVNTTTAPYACSPNLIKSHAVAVQTYRKLISEGKVVSGKISLKHDSPKPVPFDPNSHTDLELVERVADIRVGIFSQPIYVDGDYPQRVLDTFPPTVLRRFTDEEKKMIKGSADFYAIDAYSTDVAKTPEEGIEACASDMNNPHWPLCVDTSDVSSHSLVTGWAVGGAGGRSTPQLLRNQLKWLSSAYPSPGGIYISEFGYVEQSEVLDTELYRITWDVGRAGYYLDSLNEILLAIHEDKIDLRGTLIWAPVDNLEWSFGFLPKFGLQHVNFSAPELTRTYKMSFFRVRDFFKQHLSD